MNDEDDADEAERAEAAALAQALEDETPEQPAPEDALAAALLLRDRAGKSELAPERADAILQQLVRGSDLLAPRARSRLLGRQPTGASRRHAVLRLWPLGAGLAAAAALLLMLRTGSVHESAPALAPPTARTALPRASAELLAAQAGLVRARGADAANGARFERELRAYRAELFRALESAYPARLSALEPTSRSR